MYKSQIEKQTMTPMQYENKKPRAASESSCGKAIIAGEHAVVYGSRAVAIPLKQMRITLHINPIRESECKSSKENPFFSLKLGGKEVSQRIKTVIPDTLSLLGQRVFSLNATGHSQLPIGAGLGSSASLCIVMIKAIAKSTHQSLPVEKIAYLGNELEKRFHGNPSGLDTMVVAHEEVISFSRANQTKIIKLDQAPPQLYEQPSWNFALIDSSIRASTLDMIEKAKPYFEDPQGDLRIERFDQIALAVEKALVQFDIEYLSELMIENGALLNEAGVVPESLTAMMAEISRLGIKASKTTGAGGGGSLLCLLDADQQKADSQINLLKSQFGYRKVFRVCL